MPWHRSIANPCKVYNERHEQACICETPEHAALIVEAVNLCHFPKLADFIGLPLVTARPADTSKSGDGHRKTRQPDPDDDGSFAIV